MSKIILLFIGCALLCFIPTHTTHAATFSVCTLGELEAAITTANSNAQADTINFNCSTTLTVSSLLIILFDSGNPLTITANGNTVIFDGEDSRRLFLTGPGASLTLDNFTFQNGFAANGGAIINGPSATMTITNSTLINSRATTEGGIIANAGTLNIINSTLDNGLSTNGGAIYNSFVMNINNTTFINHSANSGGAIYHVGASSTIDDSVFITNSADSDGGAIYTQGSLTITNTTFRNNTASGSGGAIYARSSLSIDNSVFEDNGATVSGSAIVADSIVINSRDSHYENNTCVGTITDNGGNTVTNATGCPGTPPIILFVTPLSCVGNNVAFMIVNGDGNFSITGTGADLPIPNTVATTVTLIGPSTWTAVRITELRGNRESLLLGDITCPAAIPISASATCIGADLQVTITSGDTPFDILDDTITFYDDVVTGGYLITGPITAPNLRVIEQAGDAETFPLGDFDCFISETLTVTATCNGANLDVTISNGNAPFTIDVNGSITTGNPLGIYNFVGPNTFAVSVREESGDGEQFTTSVTCTTPIVPVVPLAPAPILPPDPTALGCELTTNINLANAPDDTYCRVLMRNGGVVSYSGAIPADLISLGVILAVDVYRLEGGRSITEFPNYARVCLSGQGRLFYMDSRNAPRVAIELATETEGSLTCGWIPAPGTLILTN